FFFFFQAEDGIRDFHVTGVQTCALPISAAGNEYWRDVLRHGPQSPHARVFDIDWSAHIDEGRPRVVLPVLGAPVQEVVSRGELTDRKSTRLNSSHVKSSYAVFCLKKKIY